MFHGLNNSFLYSAYRLAAVFVNDSGDQHTVAGTGFWVQNNDSRLVLVTNRHMLDAEVYCAEYAGYRLQRLICSGKAKDDTAGRPSIKQEWTVDHSDIRCSPVDGNDIACLIDPKVTVHNDRTQARIDYSIPRAWVATSDDFESELSICDFVAFPGFPEWHDHRGHRPILRTGTISSDPRYNYSWTTEDRGECMAYEAFSYGGSSGSPVFALQKGLEPGAGITFQGYRDVKLIGINAGHLPAAKGTHSGISYMYKSSAILATIDAGVRCRD